MERTTADEDRWGADWPEVWRILIEGAAAGEGDRELAERLHLSTSTVDYHWRQLRKHLGARTRTQAVVSGLGELSRRQIDLLRRQLAEARTEAERSTELLESERQRHAAALRELQRALLDDRRERESLRRLERSLEVVGAVAYRMANHPPFPCRFISESVARYGYSPSEFTSGRRGLFDVVHPEDLALLSQILPESARKRDRYASFTFRFLAVDGRAVWMLDQNWEIDTEDGVRAEYAGVAVPIERPIGGGLIQPFPRRAWWPGLDSA